MLSPGALDAVKAWALPAAALAAGAWGWGWPGVVLAITVIVFGLLLQFSRALRLMRQAASSPKGSLRGSAVALHSRLRAGQRLPQVMRLTGSFGLPDETAAAAGGEEVYRWRDSGGDAVRVRLRAARVVDWTLERGGSGAADGDAAGAPPPAA